MTTEFAVEVVSVEFLPQTNSLFVSNGSNKTAAITIKNPTVNPLAYKITIGIGPASGMTTANMIVTASGVTGSITAGAQSTISIPVTIPVGACTTQEASLSVLGAVRIQENATQTDLVGTTSFPYLTDASWDINISMDKNATVTSILWDSAVTEISLTFDNGTQHTAHVKVKNNSVNTLSLRVNKVVFVNDALLPIGGYVFDTSSMAAFNLAAGAEVVKDIVITIPASMAAQGTPIPCDVYAYCGSGTVAASLYGNKRYGGSDSAVKITVNPVSGVGVIGVTWS